MSITHYQENQNQQNINKEVEVRSLSFTGKGNFKTFPKQISIDTEEITFIETGMRYILQKGQSIIQLFDMTDGQKNYRLQFDTTSFTWTLVRISPLAR
ncbi:hypothetical protein KDA11_04310 [Candidatus Saccharibacteria bacterium]|nr:hypothetical protein [Candidatus Saccharibacteria bacterium]